MNNPLEMLYAEHEVIKSAIDIAKSLKELTKNRPDEYEDSVRRMLIFFRGFADEYHHFKEEQVLFPEMKKKNEILAGGVIFEMNDNHEEFRVLLKDIESSLDAANPDVTQKLIEAYAEKLLDHIAVENEEVFQMAETLFNQDELEKIAYRFEDIDRDFGSERKVSLVELIEMINEDM